MGWVGFKFGVSARKGREKCNFWLVAHNDLVITTLGCLRVEGGYVHTYKRSIFFKRTSPLH